MKRNRSSSSRSPNKNKKQKTCSYPECNKQPTFNSPSESVGLYCASHAKEDMVNVISKRCLEEECNKIPVYNLSSESVGLYCVTHAKEDMVNVKNKRCLEEGCNKQPVYNLPSEKFGLYCVTHAKEDMVNVKDKKCLEEGCNTHPCYNFPSEKVGLYCYTHAKEDMVDVKNKRCLEEGCNTHPSYNLPSEIVGLYCVTHAKEDMVNVKHKRCLEEGCTTRPHYNFSSERGGQYCAQHKQPGMISMCGNKCQSAKCKQVALFGLVNKRAQYCSVHKLPNMINIIEASQCCTEGCLLEWLYVFTETGKKYCSDHYPDQSAVAVQKRLCKYCDMCDLTTHVCAECSKNRHKKEWAVVRHLRKEIRTPFVYDQSSMLNGCSKKRPDIFFELNEHCIIVEVDENEHSTYQESCECARMSEIVSGIGGRSVTFIRYNPDKILSRTGVVYIPTEVRIKMLVDVIREELIRVPEKFEIRLIQLYYSDVMRTYMAVKYEDVTLKLAV